MILKIIFFFFVSLAAISAMALLFIKNVFKAALALLVCLIAIAGIYVLSFAEFIAVTQILIYAGGILVVIIFGIMLTSKISGKALLAGNNNLFSGSIAGLMIFGILIYFFQRFFTFAEPEPISPSKQIETIGTNLMTSHSLPFELAGILLLVSLVGAAVIASFMKSKEHDGTN